MAGTGGTISFSVPWELGRFRDFMVGERALKFVKLDLR